MPEPSDEERMRQALSVAEQARPHSSPNPWVGCVLVPAAGEPAFTGASAPPGGPHAEVAALAAAKAAGVDPAGSTVYVTLEPCSHFGRTPPCADGLIEAKVARVVVALSDPDPQVSGAGLQKLRDAGIDLTTGVLADEAERQLAPYLKHRRTGRPWVTLKLAATIDGRTAAADGSSRWITGEEARRDTHRLRSGHDAVLVGAGTIRTDDPELTVRHVEGNDPLRVVLGTAPPDAKVHPCIEVEGELGEVLDILGGKGVLSLLVEGGATVAGEFHRQGLVDRYVIYLAPAILGPTGRPLIDGGIGAETIADAWRGEITEVARLGPDLRIELMP